MKTAFAALVAGTLLSIAGLGFAQTVKKFTVTFHTTKDDKNTGTQVRDCVVFGGVNHATLLCCSGENPPADHWDVNSKASRVMANVIPITKAQLRSGRAQFVLGSAAAGNGKWTFIPTLTAAYSDKTTDRWTFPETTLDSEGSHVAERTYLLPHR